MLRAVLWLVVSGVFTVAPSASGAGTAGDYDGDGYSDLAVGIVDYHNKKTDYLVYSTGKNTTSTFSFNTAAAGFVPGRYAGYAVVLPAVVDITAISFAGFTLPGYYTWYANAGQGPQPFNAFGAGGDVLVPADYNCDGAADLAVSGDDRVSRSWSILMSTGELVDSIRFGKTSDRVFGADIDGDNCAELIAVRVIDGAAHWISRKYNSSAESDIVWGALYDMPLRPFDLNGDGRPELVMVRSAGGMQTAHIRFADGSTATKTLGADGTVPMIGQFNIGRGFAIFDRLRGTFTLSALNGASRTISFGGSNSVVIRPDGSFVLPVHDERLIFDNRSGGGGSSSGSPGSYGGGPSGSGGSHSSDPLRCDRYRKANDGRANFVHNPKTSRRTFKMVLPSDWTGQVRAIRVAKNGKIIENMRYEEGYEYGFRERWYAKKPSNRYPKNIIEIVEFYNGEQVCIKIANPAKRYD